LICATISEIFDNQGGDRDLMVLPIKKYRNIWKVVFLAANNRRILLAAKNTPAPDKPNILWVIRPSNPPYKVAARGVMLFFGFVPRGTAKRAPVTSIEKRFGLDNSSSRGLAHLVVAALPKIPVCALKIGDRTSTTDVTRGSCTGFRRARSFRVWGLGGRVEEGAHEDEPPWFYLIYFTRLRPEISVISVSIFSPPSNSFRIRKNIGNGRNPIFIWQNGLSRKWQFMYRGRLFAESSRRGLKPRALLPKRWIYPEIWIPNLTQFTQGFRPPIVPILLQDRGVGPVDYSLNAEYTLTYGFQTPSNLLKDQDLQMCRFHYRTEAWAP